MPGSEQYRKPVFPVHASRDGTIGQSFSCPHVKIWWTENPLLGGRKEHCGNPRAGEMETRQVRATWSWIQEIFFSAGGSGFCHLHDSSSFTWKYCRSSMCFEGNRINVLEKWGPAQSTAVFFPFTEWLCAD